MGLTNLIGAITGQKQTVQFIQNTNGVVINLDCTLKETHARESPPTEFPIENGTTVSDHILVKPFTLEIEGVISDTPISAINAALTTAASALLPPLGIAAAGAGVALFSALKKTKSPSVAAYAQLLLLQDSKKPFDVLTSLKRYSNMFFKSITVPRESSTGKVLQFTVSIVQLILVSPKTVNIAKFVNSDLSAEEANLGKQELENPILQKFQQGQAAFNSLAR